MKFWGQDISEDVASAAEVAYLQEVDRRYPQMPDLQRMWGLLDEIWDQHGASADAPRSSAVQAYYRHPVWLVNGIFTDLDPTSRAHRQALCAFVARGGGDRLFVDFGGGYGALARQVAALPGVTVRIVDPYPSPLAVQRCRAFPNLQYVAELPANADVLVAQDVLEHVDQPVELAATLVRSVRVGGTLIFANCFEPCIKCHLPQTFHLKKTFRHLMWLLGCAARGSVPGCEHALVFERVRARQAPAAVLKAFEGWSRLRGAVRRARMRMRGHQGLPAQ